VLLGIVWSLRVFECRQDLQERRTPLHSACAHGHLEAMSVLLRAGANIEARARWGDRYCHGCTALYGACHNNHLEMVTALLRAGANIEACNEVSARDVLIIDDSERESESNSSLGRKHSPAQCLLQWPCGSRLSAVSSWSCS
jgi:hypothetical protein